MVVNMKRLVFKHIWILIITLLLVITGISSGITKLNQNNISENSEDLTYGSLLTNDEVDQSVYPAALNQESLKERPSIMNPENDKNDKLKIQFRIVQFDPIESEPSIPDEFRSRTFEGDSFIDQDYFLIQFIGPIKSEWKEQVKELGVDFFDYIPQYAFIAYAKLSLIPEIKKFDFIRWTGPLHQYYRIQPELLELIQDGFKDQEILDQEITISVRPIFNMEDMIWYTTMVGGKISIIDAEDFLVCDLSVASAFKLSFAYNLEWMEFYSEPELFNNKAAKSLNIRQNNGSFANNGNSLWSYNHNTGKFEGYPGKDVIIAMADSGVDGTHPTFDNKKIWFINYANNQEDTWTDGGSSAGHGTHTSGSSLGTGAWRSADSGNEEAKYAGMAPAAGLIGQAIFQGGPVPAPSKICTDAVDHGADISSNSWGWPGTAGNYDNTAVSYDGLVRDSSGKEFVIVFATGNEGSGSIRSPSTAKNVISVGATDNNEANSVTGFSSGGPTDDGRTKPDVVAPGQNVASAGWKTMGGGGKPSDGGSSYFYATGTSMAAPIASGSTAVIIDYINHTHDYIPSPALVKAILINGAKPLDGYKYPGNRQGWGRIDLANSLLETATKKFFMVNQNITLETGNDLLYYFDTRSGDQPLRITLTWTDVKGSAGSTPNLVNDLNLILESPDGNMYYGNNFQSGKSASGGEPDDLNNVEGIFIPDAPKGGWIMTISAQNIPDGPQDFALITAGDITNVKKGIRDIEILPSLDIPAKTHLEGETIVLNGSFRNSGTIPSMNVRYRIVHIDPTQFERVLLEKTVPIMDVLEVRYVEYKWESVRGAHTFRLDLDPFNVLREEYEDNNRAENSVNIDYFGLEVSSSNVKKEIKPGREVEYSINIFNNGSIEDTFSIIRTTPPAGWEATLETAQTTIQSNTTRTIAFSVTPPADALANETVELIVRVTSEGNRTYYGEIKTITNVEQYYEYHLEDTVLEKRILPGAQDSYKITINNTGNGLDHYIVQSFGGKYGWSWGLSQEFISISARGTKNVTLNVTSPEDGLANEKCVIDVKVWSVFEEKPDDKNSRRFTSYIESVYNFDLVLPTEFDIRDVGARPTYLLLVKNNGNIGDTYELKYSVPENWTGKFSNTSMHLGNSETGKVIFTLTIPLFEFPDEYNIDFSLRSRDSGIIQNYTIILELNQFYNIKADKISIKDTVQPGGDSVFQLNIENLGTGQDSASIQFEQIPQNWRLNVGNNVLGLNYDDQNSTIISLKTDILTEDGDYETVVMVASGGNFSVTQRISLITTIDSTITDLGGDTGIMNKTEDTGFSLFGLGEILSIIIVILIIAIILGVSAFVANQMKKKKKKIEDTMAEQKRLEDERKNFKENYKSLYKDDLSTESRTPQIQDFLGKEMQARPPLQPTATTFPGGFNDFSIAPKPVSPPLQSYEPRMLPQGPLPPGFERSVEKKTKKKKLKKTDAESSAIDIEAVTIGLGAKPSDKIEIILPREPVHEDDEVEFESIKPFSKEEASFEKKGPEYIKSSPMEWESVDSDDYEKGFEFGSGISTVDSKSRKKSKD